MDRRLPVAVALVTATLLLLQGANMLEASTVVIDRTDYNPYGSGDPETGPNISFTLDRPDAVTELTADLTYTGSDANMVTLRINTVDVFNTDEPGAHTVRIRPDRAGIDLDARNNLTIAVRQHFGTTPARIDQIRLTAPSQVERAAVTGMQILAVLAAFAAVYLFGSVFAARHDIQERYRTVVSRLARIVVVIGLIGAFFAIGNVMLFLALEPAVATPIMQDGVDTVQQTTRTSFTDQYRSARNTVCIRAFDLSADCTVAAMETALADRRIDTYTDVRTVIADAHRIAYLTELRTLSAPFTTDTFIEPVSRLLTASIVQSGFSIERTWRTATIENVTQRCDAHGIPPRDCLSRITAVFAHHAHGFDASRPPACPRLVIDDTLRSLHTPASNQTMVAFFQTVDDVSFAPDSAGDASACHDTGRIRSRTLSMVADIAATMRIAALITASTTNGIQERTVTVEHALKEAIP